ncbi:MAG TPA: hypothetical protein VHP36_09975 [Chitinispirillaceae bacterium]|nr:hypothetical protein [Chitinispirillaceae bacterium]
MRGKLVIIIMAVLLAVHMAAADSGSGKVSIGILLPEPYGGPAKLAEQAYQELLKNIGEIGFYEVFPQNVLQEQLNKIKMEFPAHCRDPRCVMDIGRAAGVERMLFGSIDLDENRYGLRLTLVDVIMKQKIDAVSIEGAPGVNLTEIVKTAVARLHGNVTAETSSFSIYQGPRVHNEKKFLISSAGVIGAGLVYGLVNYFSEYQDAHKLYAEYRTEDCAGISSLADQIPLFARPAALGNAYVAASDDAYGVFYNPAGMAWVRGAEAVLAYQYRFGLDNIAATYVNKATREIGFGQGLLYSADKDHMLTEIYFITSVAYKFTHLPDFIRPFSLGVNLKIATQRVKGTTENSVSGNSLGAGIDFGFLWELSERIRYGLLLKDVPVISHWKNVSTGETYNQASAASLHMGGTFRAGYKTFLIGEGQIPITKEQNWKMAGGIEQEIFRYFLLRAGLQKEVQTTLESPWRITGGLGINVKRFSIDGSYEYNTLKVFDVINVSVHISL